MLHQRVESPLKLDGLGAARRFFAGCLAEGDPLLECLWVAHVDEEANCLQYSSYGGDRDGVRMPIRTILRDALLQNSKGIILAHNHPSGDAQPSEADLRMTRSLGELAAMIDVTVLDHLIFGGCSCTSMRQMGFL